MDDPCKINVAALQGAKSIHTDNRQQTIQPRGKEVGDLIRYNEYNTLAENLIRTKLFPSLICFIKTIPVS